MPVFLGSLDVHRVTTTPVEFVITAGESAKRIDLFLANRDPTFSRSALKRLIEEGCIQINGRIVRPSQKIKPGDRIRLEVPRPEPLISYLKPFRLRFSTKTQMFWCLINQPGWSSTRPPAIGRERW